MENNLKYYIYPMLFLFGALSFSIKLHNSNIFNKNEVIDVIFRNPSKIGIDESINLNIKELKDILYQCEVLNADISHIKTKNQTIISFNFKREEPFFLNFYFKKNINSFKLLKLEGLSNFQELINCIKQDSI